MTKKEKQLMTSADAKMEKIHNAIFDLQQTIDKAIWTLPDNDAPDELLSRRQILCDAWSAMERIRGDLQCPNKYVGKFEKWTIHPKCNN